MLFFFFKQKTAYEMRISDWSSDVCSSDLIGTLARALSDMTQALRERIDAGEHFAADVTHELKNPIASVRSAIEGLGRVTSDEQRAQLLRIADEDVRRLDRLVSDISEASRVDAQLSRTLFEPVDVGIMIESMLAERAARVEPGTPHPRVRSDEHTSELQSLMRKSYA